MDPFTHSLVGLTAAKAGLGRLSPLATTVCVVAANAPDCDIVVGLTSGRWEYLHHHRGLTHSIVGVLALGILLPSIIYALDRLIARVRRRAPRIKYRGLLLASLLVTATHPLLDWTNNYGVRPFLPWSGQWFYGDLAFVVDPYILLAVGGAAFLATSNHRAKIVLWAGVATAIIVLSFIVRSRPDPNQLSLTVVRAFVIGGVLAFALVRVAGWMRGREKQIALAALAAVVVYLGALTIAHRVAFNHARQFSDRIAARTNERFVRVAAMPMLANPFQWSCVAETDRAMYRFTVKIASRTTPPESSQLNVDLEQTKSPAGIQRFAKPTNGSAELIAKASQDRRTQILLGFARFPLARVENDNCIGQTLVQFADVRYTEPGATRGTFSLNVPVECPAQ